MKQLINSLLIFLFNDFKIETLASMMLTVKQLDWWRECHVNVMSKD
jgi:hypothetical protein